MLKRKLVKCSSRTYSELIRSDIHWPFGAKPSRPFGPSGVKLSRPSALGPPQPSIMKPPREELQARVELLAKKKKSAKRKVLLAPESSHAVQGKVPKLGASSLPSSVREQGSPRQFWARGRPPHPVAEVSKVIGSQLRSPRAAVTMSPPGRTAEPPLDILPISVRSPLAQTAKLPSRCLRARGESISILRGMRTRCSRVQSSPPGLYSLSYGTLTSRGWITCPLRRFWPCRFKERPSYVQTPLFVRSIVAPNYLLILFCFYRWPPI